MRTNLVIMAAGIGSRFGQGIKQLEVMNKHEDGTKGEIIIDYSIYDAVAAGFDKIIFIIRKEIEDEFKEVIGNRIEKSLKEKGVEVAYAFQELDKLPHGFTIPKGRLKPWGTGHAVLCAKDQVDAPFVIINADDYYGKEAFVKLHDFLVDNYQKDQKSETYTLAMAGFILKNTISENGTVTRGVCVLDDAGKVKEVIETSGIKAKDDDKNKIICDDPEVSKWINPDSKVSMNMWACYEDFLAYLEEDFIKFLKDDSKDELKKEHLLPIIVDGLLKQNKVDLTAIETEDKWIGITYKEDADLARKEFKIMLDAGKYPKKLWD
ncbi:MAG: sugar phosphate nucleotidyltransferase [Peptoniphilaceae bacterium]|nr:sugar phosphate nucleotidyltransferase [Peptoniphilaceae bacterium]MDY6018257.1 sugar phosphate nucleotidyltransferase [Anaerococcus sp.]